MMKLLTWIIPPLIGILTPLSPPSSPAPKRGRSWERKSHVQDPAHPLPELYMKCWEIQPKEGKIELGWCKQIRMLYRQQLCVYYTEKESEGLGKYCAESVPTQKWKQKQGGDCCNVYILVLNYSNMQAKLTVLLRLLHHHIHHRHHHLNIHYQWKQLPLLPRKVHNHHLLLEK